MIRKFTYSIFLLALALNFSSCMKEELAQGCPSIVYSIIPEQTDELKNYLIHNGIEATYDDKAGFFYIIENEGNGKAINSCSDVSVTYVGKLSNNSTFDSNQNLSFNLSNLIPGWRIALPYIKEGGKITIFLPAYLAYGSEGVANSIPGNAMTIFEIEVLKVY